MEYVISRIGHQVVWTRFGTFVEVSAVVPAVDLLSSAIRKGITHQR
jgi:hypothetical protein